MNLTTKPHTKTPREISQAASLAVSWAASVFSRSGPFLAREVPFVHNFYLICCCLLFGKVWIVICELGYVCFAVHMSANHWYLICLRFLHIPSVFSSLFFHVHKMLWYTDLIYLTNRIHLCCENDSCFRTWSDVSGLHSRRSAHQMKRNWDVIYPNVLNSAEFD